MRRSFRPTLQCQKIDNLLTDFCQLNLSIDSELLILVTLTCAHHTHFRSFTPELPDSLFVPGGFTHSTPPCITPSLWKETLSQLTSELSVSSPNSDPVDLPSDSTSPVSSLSSPSLSILFDLSLHPSIPVASLPLSRPLRLTSIPAH